MDAKTTDALALTLHRARLEAREIGKISDETEGLTLDAAYGVQEAGIRLREADGETVIAWKMGLTSEAKRRQMNLDSPVYGVLTDRMRIENGGVAPLEGRIHPKIEPEVGFVTSRELRGEVTREEALAACSGVFAALEILDSRFRGFKYFSLEDVVADNSSSALYATGPVREDFTQLDLTALEMRFIVDGETVHTGSSSAISGDPVLSLVQLCGLLHRRGHALPAGAVVLAGAAAPAVPLEPGMTVRLEVDGLPEASVRTVP